MNISLAPRTLTKCLSLFPDELADNLNVITSIINKYSGTKTQYEIVQ